MADRPSVKDILARARAGGPAPAPRQVEAAPEVEEAVEEVSAAPDVAPTPAASLGRPLTLKEKLAAARAGGTAPAPAAARAAAVPAEVEVPAAVAAPAEPAPTAASLGRPLTLKEKLAAARGGAASPAPAAGAAAKPAAATAAPAAKAVPASARVLPPLESMTDPRDLAEALRRTGAEKTKAAAAAKAPAAAKAVATKKPESKVVPPKPGKEAARERHVVAVAERRGFMVGGLLVSWIWLGWGALTAATSGFTLMLGRFMFPNVLAEPPSTVKVGLPSNFERGEVNERWKSEWGFWIVRSDQLDGVDKLYAVSTICTHLGCPPNWLAGEQKFKCPCHGSGFYISGINFEGPAPRPLERFKVAVGDDGQIVVDKSQKYQQELGQWSDPDSYIQA